MSETFKVKGKIETVEGKQTSSGKAYILYKIGGEKYSDWYAVSTDLKVGEEVSGVYFKSGDGGKYNNLNSIIKVPEGTSEEAKSLNEEAGSPQAMMVPDTTAAYVNPAFFGMCANQAVEISMANGKYGDEDIMRQFERLWDLWTKKKKEKGVQ